MSAIEVTEMCPAAEPLVTCEIPANEYAVFRYVGPHSPYHFERMDLNVCSDSYCEMDIYVPVLAD